MMLGKKKALGSLCCQCVIEEWRPYSSPPASIAPLKHYRPDAKETVAQSGLQAQI